MERRVFRASSVWFSSFVALVVSVGCQVLLEAVVPADLQEWKALFSPDAVPTVYRTGHEPMWVSESVIRFVSFAFGGLVGTRLACVFSWRLCVVLVATAVLATVFQQFPERSFALGLFVWFLAAPMGAVIGAWAAKATSRAV